LTGLFQQSTALAHLQLRVGLTLNACVERATDAQQPHQHVAEADPYQSFSSLAESNREAALAWLCDLGQGDLTILGQPKRSVKSCAAALEE